VFKYENFHFENTLKRSLNFNYNCKQDVVGRVYYSIQLANHG